MCVCVCVCLPVRGVPPVNCGSSSFYGNRSEELVSGALGRGRGWVDHMSSRRHHVNHRTLQRRNKFLLSFFSRLPLQSLPLSLFFRDVYILIVSLSFPLYTPFTLSLCLPLPLSPSLSLSLSLNFPLSPSVSPSLSLPHLVPLHNLRQLLNSLARDGRIKKQPRRLPHSALGKVAMDRYEQLNTTVNSGRRVKIEPSPAKNTARPRKNCPTFCVCVGV